MPTLTIYRGTHEIGGNCVELCTDSTRLVIDVGMPLVAADGEPFDSKTLRGKTVEQLLDDGTLPKVPGLFDKGPSPDAILLSHAHADHTGLLKYADPNIPVHLSKGTSKMMLAGSIFACQPGIDRKRSSIFEPEKPFQVGDFTITAYPVDHSAFDAMAFIIEAEGKRILYSGDLRMHGRKPWMAERLVRAAKEKPIDVMLMEGTNLGSTSKLQVTEHELEEQIVEHIQAAEGLVLAAFSPMNVDRLVTFYKASRRCGRVFVVDVYAAYVMYLIAHQCGIPQPEAEAGIRVYYPTYFDETYQRRGLQRIHQQFSGNRITLDEISSKCDRTVMVFRPSMVNRDFEGKLPTAATCLYSYWSGYLKGPDWIKTRRKLDSVNGTLIEAHASGHIFAESITELVREAAPIAVTPIHTFAPDEIQTIFSNVVLLHDGQSQEV